MSLAVDLVDNVLFVAVDVDNATHMTTAIVVVVIIFCSLFSDSCVQTAKFFITSLSALDSGIHQALMTSFQSLLRTIENGGNRGIRAQLPDQFGMFGLGLSPLPTSNVRNHASLVFGSGHIFEVRHALRRQHLRINVQVLLPFFELLSWRSLSKAHHIV